MGACFNYFFCVGIHWRPQIDSVNYLIPQIKKHPQVFLVSDGGPGRNRPRPEDVDPSHHQLVNLVMIPNIDRNDFIFSNDEFKRNPVLQIDRDAVQTSELSFEAM